MNILNGEYIFNIDKISEFVNYSDKSTSKETEIIDNYEGARIIGKTIRELKTPGNAQIDNIKYDLIKTLISTIISYDIGDGDNLPIGIQICVNTLIKEGFLVKIK